jgi:hypothetical protein
MFMLARCKNMGMHFGGCKTTGRGIGPHSDNSITLQRQIKLLEEGGFSYQTAHYKVEKLSQCTQTLWVLDVITNRHEELQLPLYLAWLKWLVANKDVDKFNDNLAKGGKQDWPPWVLETFEEFRMGCPDTHPQYQHKLIVLTTPPQDMFPDFEGGWVTERWITGSVHAGYHMPKRSRGEKDLFREVLYYTEPDERGKYISPNFIAEFSVIQSEIWELIKSIDDIEHLRRELKTNVQTWKKKKLRCMDGASHACFIERVVLVIASQPTREAMNATLWQSGNLEMSLDEDPAILHQRRRFVINLVTQLLNDMVADSSNTVSSLEVHISGLDTEIFEALFEVLMTRLHYYLTDTSELMFVMALDMCTLYQDDRESFRKGPHQGRGNISDSCWRCTYNGFGIFGAIFAYAHDIVVKRLVASGFVFPDELGAPGEC